MKLLSFPKDVIFGSIFELDREYWWELNTTGGRSIPKTPEFDFEIMSRKIIGNSVVIEALLTNNAESQIEIPLFPSPTIFWIRLLEEDSFVSKIANQTQPNVPPPPHVLIIPVQCQVIFSKTLDLDLYEIEENYNPIIEWTFNTWNSDDRVSGVMKLYD